MSAKDERTVLVLLEEAPGGEDRLLTYLLPTSLSREVVPGCRVVVPFRGRKSAGVVLALDVPAPSGSKLRPIVAVLDPEPVVGEVRAELAEWLAARYLALRSETYRLFLPPGAPRKRKRLLHLAVPWPQFLRRLERFILPPEDRERVLAVLAPLAARDRAPETIREELGPLARLLEILLGEGYLVWREPWQRSGPAARQVTFLRLAGEPPTGLTPKQARVVSFLAARPERAATRSEILAACGVGRSVLDRLVAMGCLTPEERTVRRVPLERQGTAAAPLFALTPGQEAAVAWVRQRIGAGGGAMLLHGVTGSGKTEVYLQAIALALAAGKTGLFLVPEIGLTPQTVERVVARFGEQVAVLHSRLGPGERYDEWERIKAGEARVVVGPRSALFAPFQDLGVVILDEEHDQSYKQEDGVRYHARTVAAELARRTGAVFIMGSATPSLEAMAAYERGEVAYFPLPERPGGRALPAVEVVDLREELRQRHLGALSRRLRAALADCLAEGGQAILLLNRRGYATFVICRECGYALRCPHCDVSLTYHRGATALLCHYCGYSLPVPDTCPKCRGRYIRYFGLGTERLCEEVAGLFPAARVARMDQDATARKGAHQELYRAMRAGEIDILVGTQMVAKGLDLPRVSLVGVVAADASLNRPDFRAAERTFQLLTQVAGRAGRGEIPGRVIFQTYNPEHYSIACAVDHDYHRFYRQERAAREAAEYPPFVELIRLGLSGREEGLLWQAAGELAGRLRAALAPAKVLGPVAALVKKVEDRYRLHILIKTPSVTDVGPALREEVARFRAARRGTDFSVVLDVDPSTVL